MGGPRRRGAADRYDVARVPIEIPIYQRTAWAAATCRRVSQVLSAVVLLFLYIITVLRFEDGISLVSY